MIHLILKNILLGLSLAAPIGPANVVMIKNGLSRGFQAGWLSGIGVVSVDVIYLLLIYFGFSNFLVLPKVQTAVWALGALALAYMGYKSIKDYYGQIDLLGVKYTGKHSPYMEGFLINVYNPIALVWWAGVFGSTFTEALGATNKDQAFLYSLAVILGLLLWITFLAVLTRYGKKFINEKNAKYVSLLAGIFLAIFALKFAVNAILSL